MTDPLSTVAGASRSRPSPERLAPENPLLFAHHLHKIYHLDGRKLAAIDDISLTISSGRFVALQGPSGSGKSTFLFVIAALLSPDSGSVQVAGLDPYQLSPSARARFRAENIGMVFQDFRLLPYLDVRSNVLAPTIALPAADHAARADELIERLGLTPRRHHLPKQLSAGEQQRCALARALLAKPKLLLADEPTGNLDEANAQQVLEQLHAFSRDGGTVLTATHDPSVAAAADQRLTIREGKLVAD